MVDTDSFTDTKEFLTNLLNTKKHKTILEQVGFYIYTNNHKYLFTIVDEYLLSI